MKRIVTYSHEADGRLRVQSISAPVEETAIETLEENMGFVSSDYTDPIAVEGKKMALYYNPETQLVEVEYSDITFDDLTPTERIDYLQKENETLKADNQLAQDAVMELYELMTGGEE